ncbi:MAG: PepSY domain-containing protein [Gemmatimonadaceae bacterium]
MKPFILSTLFAFGALAAVASAGAQQPIRSAHPTPKSDVPANLAREARISLDSARVIARAKLPKAYVQSEELERENGKLIYSFDMKTTGKSGIDEVNVNALNGSIVGKIGHESPKSEAKEAAAEHETSHRKPKP